MKDHTIALNSHQKSNTSVDTYATATVATVFFFSHTALAEIFCALLSIFTSVLGHVGGCSICERAFNEALRDFFF